jgi:hypothetical protein
MLMSSKFQIIIKHLRSIGFYRRLSVRTSFRKENTVKSFIKICYKHMHVLSQKSISDIIQ